MAVAAGSVPMDAVDLVELLAVLTADPDTVIAERAGSVLLTQPQINFEKALARPDAAPGLFLYCARTFVQKSRIVDLMVNNPACPARVFIHRTQHLSNDHVTTLMADLERLTDAPVLVAELAKRPGLTEEQSAALAEMLKDAPVGADVAEAAEAAEPDPARRLTLLQRLAQMNVVQRMQAAMKGGREERMTLIRDPNKMIQRAVLESPRLTEQEVEGFASLTQVSEEVFRVIAKSRKHMKNYIVVRNLAFNPKTPLDISLPLLPRLMPNDLKTLTSNKNVPDTLRSTALKMVRTRALLRGGGQS